MNIESFIILAMATWRLSSLFANENGFADFFVIIRRFADWLCTHPLICKTKLNEGLRCEWCNSIWFGTGLMILYLFLGNFLVVLVSPLAFSCMTIIIKYLVEALRAKHA